MPARTTAVATSGVTDAVFLLAVLSRAESTPAGMAFSPAVRPLIGVTFVATGIAPKKFVIVIFLSDPFPDCVASVTSTTAVTSAAVSAVKATSSKIPVVAIWLPFLYVV